MLHSSSTTVDRLMMGYVLWHHRSVTILKLVTSSELCTRLEWSSSIVHWHLSLRWHCWSLTIHMIKWLVTSVELDTGWFRKLRHRDIIHRSTCLRRMYHGVVWLHVVLHLSSGLHGLLWGLGTGREVRHSRLARLMVELLTSTRHGTSLVLML